MIIEALRLEFRTHRMPRFAVWVVAYGIALWLVERLSGPVPGLLWLLFWITFLPLIISYVVRGIGYVRHRLLWRLRRRLIVAYIFIAVVPILLIVLLVGLGAFIVNGQFAAFLVTTRLRESFGELKQVNRAVIHEARLTERMPPEAMLERVRKFYVSELQAHRANYPGLEITVRLGSETRAFFLSGKPIAKPISVPAWLTREEFAGIVIDEGEIAVRSVERDLTPSGEMTIILSQPLTPELLDLVGAGVGPVGVVTTQPERSEADRTRGGLHVKTPQGAYVQAGSVRSKSVQVPEPLNRFDFTVFGASTLEPVFWGGEKEQKLEQPVFVYVTSRIVALNHQLLATLGEYSQIYVLAFEGVAIIFLVIEGFALIVGIRLTRTMTQTVDKLYDATEKVKEGDFSYRIKVPARDQLSALGEAFDGMTASVERLLLESHEKTRLESELEIAREVQRQLFPGAAPTVKGLELYGVCKPARVVSGDYYDFLRLGDDRVAVVLGDISGKGISAALLMAAIQSSLRAQLQDGCSARGVAGARALSTAEIVERLNRQLYESTSTEKYATFFCAEYDSATRRLTYTNAGHLPPVVFRQDRIERLDKGGTVVGLFSPMTYDQAVIQLEPGDVLLAFTDGLTEPENIYGEEFGEERLLEVAQRALGCPLETLAEEIYRDVSDWTGSPELQDDMTMVVAKALA